MFYVIDRVGRVIVQSADAAVIKELALRIAKAGAWVGVTTDEKKIGREAAEMLENPEGLHVDPAELERLVWGPGGYVPHG